MMSIGFQVCILVLGLGATLTTAHQTRSTSEDDSHTKGQHIQNASLGRDDGNKAGDRADPAKQCHLDSSESQRDHVGETVSLAEAQPTSSLMTPVRNNRDSIVQDFDAHALVLYERLRSLQHWQLLLSIILYWLIASPFTPVLMTSQHVDYPRLVVIQTSRFEQLLDGAVGGPKLGLEIKKAEMATKDLMTLVKYSELESRDILTDSLSNIVQNAKKTGKGLQKLTAKVHGAVDK